MNKFKETEKCVDSRQLHNEGYLHIGNGKAPSIPLTSEINDNNVYTNLMQRITQKDNILKAARKVKRNNGKPGIDRVIASRAVRYVEDNYDELKRSVLKGTYTPLPVRRVSISKSNGGKRTLGIPSIKDRIIQQAIVQILDPIFDKSFSDNSFGFRRGRNQIGAIKRCKSYIEAGNTWIVDIDLQSYFDNVNHDKLIGLIYKEIKDPILITLIRKFLNAGTMEKGLFTRSTKGVPQGGNLSPLLSNIMLNELDRELTKRQLCFVRYADDCLILVKSEKAAKRVKESTTKFIESKLGLKVNHTKSRIVRPHECKFLGFGFNMHDNQVGLRIHEESVDKLRIKLNNIYMKNSSRKCRHLSKTEYAMQLIKGWQNYYGIADNLITVMTDMQRLLSKLAERESGGPNPKPKQTLNNTSSS